MNLKGYALSSNYALLAVLMRVQTIICRGQIGDRFPEFGKSVFDSSKGNDGRKYAGYRESRFAQMLLDIGVGNWQRFRILAEPHWKIDASNEPEFIRQCERLKIQFLIPVIPSKELPTSPGIYWWKADDGEDWTIVQVIDFADGSESNLSAYDIENRTFSGRSLSAWKEYFAPGQWIGPFNRPNL